MTSHRGVWNAAGSIAAAALLWASCGAGAMGAATCGDGIVQPPETCDPPGSPTKGDCCTPHPGVGCSDPECTASVCGYDPYCCKVSWDSICIGEALTDPNCTGACATCRGGCTYCGDGRIDPVESCDPPGPLGGSDCCAAHPGGGCADPVCAAAVCRYDPYCCNVAWDAICAGEGLADPDCVACVAPGLCDPTCVSDADRDGQADSVDACPLGDGFFEQTVRATSKTQFGWNFKANIDWVKGNLSLVGAYNVIEFHSTAATRVVAAPEALAPGGGLYWLVRDDCNPTTWSTNTPAECGGLPECAPGGRDGNLPPP